MTKRSAIRTSIGGCNFDDWRGSFYPADLPKTRELEYAASKLTTIEVNGTFYRSQTPATYAKWAGEVSGGPIFLGSIRR